MIKNEDEAVEMLHDSLNYLHQFVCEEGRPNLPNRVLLKSIATLVNRMLEDELPELSYEWENEPHYLELDIDGYKTKIVRCSGMGHLCGYAFLDKDNKYYGKNYDDIPVEVHGGLTYSEQNGEFWEIGFDCAHSGDYIPSEYNNKYRTNRINKEVYRNIEFVKKELIKLVEQLKEG